MIKKLWVIGIVAGVIAIPLVARHEHRAREYYESRRTQDCLRSALSLAERHDCQKDAQSRKDYVPWWDDLFAWPAGIETLALIATLAAIIWQAYETRRAANAQADGNRAWVFADLEKLGGQMYSVGSGDGPPKTYLMLRLNFSNQGLSPAWVETIQAHMEILPRKQTPPKKVEFYSFPYRFTLMVKGKEIMNPNFECLGHLTGETDDLFIWIVIKYHDGHGIQGETSLGYGMNPSGMLFRQSNIPQRNYNK